MVRSQLKSMDTVGQILDVMKFSVKMLLVENCVGNVGIILLNEIFLLLPENWQDDPVKVCTVTQTKLIFFLHHIHYFLYLAHFLHDLYIHFGSY